MHEYSIIQSLVDVVERSVGDRGVPQRIEVRIGELSGVDCGLLATAYEVFRAGTLCETATMTIDRVAVRQSDGTWRVDNLSLGASGNWTVRVIVTGEHSKPIVLDAPIVIAPTP